MPRKMAATSAIISALVLPSTMAAPNPPNPPATAPATQSSQRPATRPVPIPRRGALPLSYTATQKQDTVTVTVRGQNPTAGYENVLVPSKTTAGPPEFVLVQKRPTGIVAQMISPFQVRASFKSEAPVKVIIVRDATGRRQVPVEQEQPPARE